MAYDPKNLSVLVQGPRKVWMHVSSDGLDKDADAYFEDPRLSLGDVILDVSDNTVVGEGQLLMVENITNGTITLGDLQSGNLT